MVLPLLLVLVSAFTVRLTGHSPVNATTSWRSDKPAVVIIDAGHGGKDPGAHGINGALEKDITLSLAQKVNELAGQYNIRVIMTRNNDELPGNTNDIKTALQKRVEITTEKKADLFVSLHTNANGNNAIEFPGIEAYVAGRRTDAKAETLATILLQQLSPVYNTSLVIQKRTESGIWVLDKCPCPAVLLECGNISLAEDEKFMTDKNNQEKLARGILAGIVKYLDSNR
jgi:N-acetylmuramoyl-L-alanine amidase